MPGYTKYRYTGCAPYYAGDFNAHSVQHTIVKHDNIGNYIA